MSAHGGSRGQTGIPIGRASPAKGDTRDVPPLRGLSAEMSANAPQLPLWAGMDRPAGLGQFPRAYRALRARLTPACQQAGLLTLRAWPTCAASDETGGVGSVRPDVSGRTLNERTGGMPTLLTGVALCSFSEAGAKPVAWA